LRYTFCDAATCSNPTTDTYFDCGNPRRPGYMTQRQDGTFTPSAAGREPAPQHDGVRRPGYSGPHARPHTSTVVLNGAGFVLYRWTGPDCTGTSAVVSGDVADLSTIGFDKKIVSIRFGG